MAKEEVKSPSAVELKARAYDILAQIEQLQMELQKINQMLIQEINDRQAKPEVGKK